MGQLRQLANSAHADAPDIVDVSGLRYTIGFQIGHCIYLFEATIRTFDILEEYGDVGAFVLSDNQAEDCLVGCLIVACAIQAQFNSSVDDYPVTTAEYSAQNDTDFLKI